MKPGVFPPEIAAMSLWCGAGNFAPVDLEEDQLRAGKLRLR